jgi:Fic family protein
MVRRGPTGRAARGPTLAGEAVLAFVPRPLPPVPAIAIDGRLGTLIDETHLALGRLDGVSAVLPDANLFRYTYVRREAVLSSQIEGTQSSLSDLLLFEMDSAPGAPIEDARSVSNYVEAMERGLERVRAGVPLTGRLFKELHGILLGSGRGSRSSPGEYRRTQNWVGGTRPGNATFIPPPADRVAECMGDLERFLNDRPAQTPPLLKAALAHVQFETIHPFLDGNGRLGRLLVTLVLCAARVLEEPLLYLSLYLKRNRARYYALLQDVRAEGDWEAWLTFFFEGVRETADQAAATARKLAALFRADRERLRGLGRAATGALRVHEVLQKKPLISIPHAVKATGLTFPTAAAAVRRLEENGVLREITGKSRGRIFAYDRYLKALGERPS